MPRLLKQFWWELRDEYGRMNLLAWMLRDVPGEFGAALRYRKLRRHFGSCGERVRINEGFRFRNLHGIHVADGAEIGVDNFLQGGGGIHLGRDVMLGPGVKIWSVNHRYDDPEAPIAEQGYNKAEVRIGDGCWLGANVIVLPGVCLPEGCVVSAGSVVGIKRYPPHSVIAGFPARVIGNRKAEPEPRNVV